MTIVTIVVIVMIIVGWQTGDLSDGVRVGDVPKKEGVAGHGGAGGAAVFALDDLTEFFCGQEN